MQSQQVFVAVLLFALATGAAAHGGTLHEWPSTPSGSNYIRTKVASCNSWRTGQGRVAYFLSNGSATPSSTQNIIVKGDATIWQYLYHNCSVPAGSPPSASVEFNVTLTRGDRPVGGVTLDGVAATEPCGARVASPYYLNLTAVPRDNDDNILWFHNFTTNNTGRVHGSGANDGSVLTAGDNAVRSLMIVNTNTAESLACCDLTLAGPADTDWAATLQGKGNECEEDGHGHVAAAAAAADPHAAHAGHNAHDGHDHGAMVNSSKTAGPATSSAAAGRLSGGAFAVAVLVAGVLAVL